MPKEHENSALTGDFVKEIILSFFEGYKSASLNEKTKKLEGLVDSIKDYWFLIENNLSLKTSITEKIMKELDFSDLNSFQEKAIIDFYNEKKHDDTLGEIAKNFKNKIYDDHLNAIQNIPADKINFSKLILSIEVIREGMIEKNAKNANKDLKILLNKFDFSKLASSEVAEISEPDSLSPLKKRKLSDSRHRKVKSFLFDKYLEDKLLAEANSIAKGYPKSKPAQDLLFQLNELRIKGEVVNLKNAAAAALNQYDKEKIDKNLERRDAYIKEIIKLLPKKTGEGEETRDAIIKAITDEGFLKRNPVEEKKINFSSLPGFDRAVSLAKKMAVKKIRSSIKKIDSNKSHHKK